MRFPDGTWEENEEYGYGTKTVEVLPISVNGKPYVFTEGGSYVRIRYEKNPNGGWKSQRFETKRTVKATYKKLPPDVEKAIAMLSHLDNNTEIEGVGYKVTEDIYYVD